MYLYKAHQIFYREFSLAMRQLSAFSSSMWQNLHEDDTIFLVPWGKLHFGVLDGGGELIPVLTRKDKIGV